MDISRFGVDNSSGKHNIGVFFISSNNVQFIDNAKLIQNASDASLPTCFAQLNLGNSHLYEESQKFSNQLPHIIDSTIAAEMGNNDCEAENLLEDIPEEVIFSE